MLNFMDIGIKLLLHHRMKLLPERKIKGIKSLKKMLDKAEVLEKGGAVQ
jgi:quinone-modifying oxidoreductase subunit QmoC